MRAMFRAAALFHLMLGAYMAAAPRSFAETVGRYGAANDHFVRDNATINLAFAVGLLVAATRSDWRVPVLGVVAAQYLFHTVSHVIDIGEADSAFLGVGAVMGLAAITAGIALVLVRFVAEPVGHQEESRK